MTRGGSGAVIVWPNDETEELRAPAGQLCSSFRAEMLALVTGLEALTERDVEGDLPIIICSDSMSALATLRNGPAAQTSPLGVAAWKALLRLGSAVAVRSGPSGSHPTVASTTTRRPTG